jgi:hypothetical protein
VGRPRGRWRVRRGALFGDHHTAVLAIRQQAVDLCFREHAHIPPPRRPRPPAVMAELRAFGKDYAKRERQLDRDLQRLRRDRAKAIKKAKDAGVPSEAIGEALGLSKQRVHEILRGR